MGVSLFLMFRKVIVPQEANGSVLCRPGAPSLFICSGLPGRAASVMIRVAQVARVHARVEVDR